MPRELIAYVARSVGKVLLICIVLDFFPYYGRPAFRYTGSDPSIPVWNFGVPPFITLVYDARSGFHVFPFSYLLFMPAQTVLLAAWTVAAIATKQNQLEERRHADVPEVSS